jgi:rhodanese-related sulfurtransferase
MRIPTSRLRLCCGLWRSPSLRGPRLPTRRRPTAPPRCSAGLQKDDEIVVYCSNPECLASLAVYDRLSDHGYTNVRRHAGGLNDWAGAGLPLEGEWVRRLGAVRTGATPRADGWLVARRNPSVRRRITDDCGPRMASSEETQITWPLPPTAIGRPRSPGRAGDDSGGVVPGCSSCVRVLASGSRRSATLLPS